MNNIIAKKIEDFNNLYQQLLSIHPNINIDNVNNPDLNKHIGMSALEIIQNPNVAFSIKEEIVSKVIILMPYDVRFYYIMGTLYKSVSLHKAIIWFNLCLEKSPEIITECVNELSVIYMTNSMFRQFLEMNKNRLFEKLFEDTKKNYIFINAYLNICLKFEYTKNVINLLLRIIKDDSNKPSLTEKDKYSKWWNYHHIGLSYLIASDPENAVKYTGKAEELANKFELTNNLKILSFQNKFAFYDYLYFDFKDHLDRSVVINKYMPNNNDMFSFDDRFTKKQKIINVGYLSSDFAEHPVSNFIKPILENHTSSLFKVSVFVNLSSLSSEYIDFFKKNNISYHIIHELSDVAAAKLIYNQNIDILFDLNGHTVNNRIDIFALNPAPIQVSYLGFPNTTGLHSIRYRITDSVADTINTKQQYTEKLIRLPKCFLLYKNRNNLKPTTPRITNPTEIIIGALNKEKKNNKQAFETWKIILSKNLNTKIMVKLETFDNMDDRIQFYCNNLGITKDRLIVLQKLANEEYNVLFTKIDILLDTFPYTGTTTTCDALFNSVPVVTMSHKNYHCHNVSASILKNAGLSELITNSKEKYIEKVNELIQNIDKLNEYKRTISKKFIDSMNPTEFMESYENVLKDLHNSYYNNV